MFILVECPQDIGYDIYFVVDGSQSITSRNFLRVREFLSSFISELDIGKNANQVGLIQFSEESLTSEEYSFNDIQDKLKIVQTINEMTYHGGRYTFTGSALKIVVDSVNTPKTFSNNDII